MEFNLNQPKTSFCSLGKRFSGQRFIGRWKLEFDTFGDYFKTGTGVDNIDWFMNQETCGSEHIPNLLRVCLLLQRQNPLLPPSEVIQIDIPRKIGSGSVYTDPGNHMSGTSVAPTLETFLFCGKCDGLVNSWY